MKKDKNNTPFTHEIAALMLPKSGFTRITQHGNVWAHDNGVEVHVHMGMTAIMAGKNEDMEPMTIGDVVRILDGHGITCANVPDVSRVAPVVTVDTLRADARRKNKKRK